MNVTDDSQWYVQKGSRVQGPFTADEVGRFLLLGRVRNTDRVSRDGELWEPVTQVPELIPEALLDLDTEPGWNRFLDARRAGDDRSSELPVDEDRRAADDDAALRLRDEWHSQPLRDHRQPGIRQSLLPWSLLGLTLGVLGVVLYLNSAAAIG